MEGRACFIFLTNDVPRSPDLTSLAAPIANELLNDGFWAFTDQAPVKSKLQPGDQVLIYLAGPLRRYFMASAVVDSKLEYFEKDSSCSQLLDKFGLPFMRTGIRLGDVSWFVRPGPIRELILKLTFIRDKKNYGRHLRLPVARIPEHNFYSLSKKVIYRQWTKYA